MFKKLLQTADASDRKKLSILFLIVLISSLLELVGLSLVIPFVNLMMSEKYVSDYINTFPSLKLMLSMSGNYRLDAAIWFIAFYFVKNSLLGFLSLGMHTIQKNLHAKYINRLFYGAMNVPYLDYTKKNSSDTFRLLTYDATNFGECIFFHSTILLAELFIFAGVILVLAIQHLEALLVILFIAFLLVGIFTLLKKRLIVWGSVMQRREETVLKNIQEGIGAYKDIIVLGVRDYFLNKFNRNIIVRSRMKRNRDVGVLIPRFLIETLIMFLMSIMMLWISETGGLEKNFPFLAFLAIVIVRMLPMSNRIMNSFSAIKSHVPSINAVFTRLENEFQQEQLGAAKKSAKYFPKFKSIELKKVFFQHANHSHLLRDISFKVNQGEVIGIVGKSGAGKSTLVDIMLGLLIPKSGSVLYNGTTDLQLDLESWRRQIGYVQQNIFLVDGTIRENIAFGIDTSEINDESVLNAVRLSKLEDWVKFLPNGLDTNVGERGIAISGGQRQRIGIARALYHDPEILFFDEATSALDNQTEKKLMEDVYSMRDKRTIVLIAHRMSTIRECDKIILLDNGVVAAIGTYKTLLSENKIFQALSMKSSD